MQFGIAKEHSALRVCFAKSTFTSLEAVGSVKGKVQGALLVDWQTLIKIWETCSCASGDFIHLLAPLLSATFFYCFGLSHAKKNGMRLYGNTISKKILSIHILKFMLVSHVV